MKAYVGTFQHFQTGQWISAKYSRKILKLEMLSTLQETLGMIKDYEELAPEQKEEIKKEYKETEEWVKQYTGKKFDDVEEAKEHFLKLMYMDENSIFKPV